MSWMRGRDGGVGAATTAVAAAEPAAGKRTLTEQLPAVQRRAEAGADGGAADDVHAAAAHGTRGPAGPLPFRDQIQRAFGRHDVSGVQAHVGGAAAEGAGAMGAQAFATGDHVAFAGAPNLHTAAHEAAHVVQQAGGVQLAGGVGRAGDAYEQHADAVADAVVAGRSAEGLLDASTGASAAAAGAGAVQRKLHVDAINGGEAFDPEIDFVQSTWGFTPAEKGIYRRWLKDDQEHRYPTKQALKDAIHRVAIQPFGTDIAAAYQQPQEQVAIFKQALEAGYRVFDSAATYETLENLWAAVKALRIPRDELTIIYKIKPTDDVALEQEAQQHETGPQDHVTGVKARRARADKVESKLAKAQGALDGALPDVLMLHDLAADLEVVEATLRKFAGLVKAGKAKAVGVSNASKVELELLQPIAIDAGAPIRYVQNRASPYHRDDDVRQYCADNGIQYMAYGMMGSAQVGACAGVGDEGEGLPTQYLLARHDPRLQQLARQRGISEGELLLAWAQARGIAPVTFTSRSDQAQKNFERAAQPLPPQLAQQLDEMFVTPSAQANERVTQMDDGPLKALYAANPDPTAWYILDTLRTADGGEALLTTTAAAVRGAHPEGEEQAHALHNFSLKLVRHVADIQSVIQRMQTERAGVIKANEGKEEPDPVPVVPYRTWLDALLPAFRDLAAAAEAPHVLNLFIDWAKRSALIGHTMAGSTTAWPEMTLAPNPDDVHPEVNVGNVGGGQDHEDHDEVAQEQAVTLAYGTEGLAAVLGTLAEAEPEDFVTYQGANYQVVVNHPEQQQIVLRPFG